jgi:NAD-dependent SIR2 family protein deacetylase
MQGFGPVIPQIDSCQNAPQQPSDKSLQCKTCHEIFAKEDELNYHNNAQLFDCDECFICFTTQVIAYLHELETHPNTLYANMYIPQSTNYT